MIIVVILLDCLKKRPLIVQQNSLFFTVSILWQKFYLNQIDCSTLLGGNTKEELQKAKVILWNGYCLVHTRFQEDHIEAMRDSNPEAQIVVHPECKQDVIQLADAVGSTGFIPKFVEKAPSGATIAIGTKISMIERPAFENPDKKNPAIE